MNIIFFTLLLLFSTTKTISQLPYPFQITIKSTKEMAVVVNKVKLKIKKNNVKKNKNYYSPLLHKLINEYILLHHPDISTEKQIELEKILYEKIMESLETNTNELPIIFSSIQFYKKTNNKKNKIGNKIYSLLSISDVDMFGFISAVTASGIQAYKKQNNEEIGILKLIILAGICSAILRGVTFFTKKLLLKKYFRDYQQYELEIVACKILIENALKEIEK